MALEKLGPYRIERVLGQGGMGTVYAAIDERNGQQAAIKVLSTLLGDRPNLRARFESEIDTLKRLRHAHIVQLLGYGEQDGHLFYAMELVDGRSLQDELKEGRTFQIAEVIRFGIEIAAALKLAHDSGIIHRDIKPANLMLTRDGQVKLTDFGIAKLFGASQLTADGGVVGTVDYMSPEQADGKPVTARSDLYSVGGVLYALIARRPPFTGRSLPQIIHALKYDAPIPLRRLAPDVPEELERIIHQLLEKEPAKRVATSLILGNRLKALEHALQSPPASQDQDYDLSPLGDGGGATNASHLTGRSDVTGRAGAPGASDQTGAYDLSSATDLTTDLSAGRTGHAPLGPGIDLTWDSSPPPVAPGARTVPPLMPPANIDRSSPTQIDPIDARQAAENSRFTTVAEDERRRRRAQQQEQLAERNFTAIKVLVGFICVVILVAGAFLLSRAPGADPLYLEIQTAAMSGDGDSLAAVEYKVDQFLEIYPEDPRREEVAAWKKQLTQALEQRRFDRRIRRPDEAALMTPIERMYAEAMQDAATKPDATVVRLQALVDAFGPRPPSDERSRRALELAVHQLERLTPLLSGQRAAELDLAQQQLAWADEQRAKDGEQARRVYQALVQLYREKPWAEPIVKAAQARLDAAE
ncbi:MAG: protein kinase [Pirellulales bacterium]